MFYRFTFLFTIFGFALNIAKAQSVSAWYNYGQTLSDMGYNVDYYRTHIFPDSIVQVEYAGGLGYVWMHGLGAVLDPTSYLFDNGITQEIGSADPYFVDSISFSYRYFRAQNGAPDTLIIQFFKQENIYNMYEDPWAGDPQWGGRSYARIAYDTLSKRGTTPFKEIIKLLTLNDTASSVKYLSIPIEEVVNGGEIIAATVTYLPGNAYNVGDTLDWEATVAPTNRINDFVMNYYVDRDDIYEVGVYNHGIIATADARYHLTDFNWQGQYWPGVASGNGVYHANISFKITTTTDIPEGEELSLNCYPVPADQSINIVFNGKREVNQASVQFVDLSGKVVLDKTVNIAQGEGKIHLELGRIKPGIYTLIIADEGIFLAAKQVVIM